ncbi:glycosyltransferase family 2 protein [Vibrio sp. DW001]|uniref:glycosyltransferase family 2 protein n=1 Tax=Vibrio sp. DW001 TaxID=2912315 RepID=UPI0023B03BF5|nr:glycosyltransferase family 2 protein [Vibrio sp. DW001]WED25957.1 glycosyltransferase family 2 protein [Vibrio sp. DW001]
MYRACFLIPCYNHGSTVADIVESLRLYNIPIILVDDGSELTTRTALQEQALAKDVTLITLSENQGKGGAVMAGLHAANTLGYSHAVQIDADGQHDLQTLPSLIALSQKNPKNVISGHPIYDDSVPKSRLYGRYITHMWVWIETLSFEIKDSMCGFRAYPVKETVQVLNKNSIGKRMDFDTEIMVRMYWDGIEFNFVDTRVIYPIDGISHFDALWDNIKISTMHTKLFFGMLPRIPTLLSRKRKGQSHWSTKSERGTLIGIKLLLAIYSFLGRPIFTLILRAVMGYYYLTGSHARKASEQYITQIKAYHQKNGITTPKNLTSYQHLLSFGQTILDKFAAWKGDIRYQDLTVSGAEVLDDVVKQNQGIILLGSHLGNIELCRAMSRKHKHLKINALVFTEHAEKFNTVMNAVNPNSNLNLIEVTEMGADTAIKLQQKIEQGEWIVIVGDRTSVSKEKRVIWADFLGKSAPFPQGPFMLASVLKAPVFLLFGLRDEGKGKPHFNVYFEAFRDKIVLPRGKREEALQEVVQDYAHRLEHHTISAPLQWYNFFNFWNLSDNNND